MNAIIIGNKITEGRKNKELSQAQFAQMLCVSAQAVGKWERGESLPDVIMLGKIAEVFGRDLNYFSADTTDKAVICEKVKTNKGRNMSFAQWKDADFSGFSNLDGKMSCANLENCKFVNADLGGIVFKANNMQKNDFTSARFVGCRFSMANVEKNNFAHAALNGVEFSKCNIDYNSFEGADFTNALVKGCNFDDNNMTAATLSASEFNKNNMKRVLFNGVIKNCSFVFNNYSKVQFVNVTFTNVFFKGKMKRGVTFVNCKADNISYAFLKASGANMEGVSLSS